jgi:predicted nucleic acid-binding protein
VILLDTTVLSNFARIERPDLLRLALPDAATTPQVITELERGVAAGYLMTHAWDWLELVRLTSSEKANLARIRLVLDDGEASCIAVALERKASLFSDDMDARHYARRQGISVSGTLGVLSLLVKGKHLSIEDADDLLLAMIAQGYRSPVSSLTDLNAGLNT